VASSHRTIVTAEGIELAALEDGDRSRPTIVLVHGYPDTKELWDGVVSRLAPGFHVVAYDVRGAGSSSAPRGPAAYALERLGEDFAAVCAALAPGRQVHLVGHDWGGIQGWELACSPRFQHTLASLTAIAAPALDQAIAAGPGLVRRGRLLRAIARAYRSWYVIVLCLPGGPSLVWRVALGGGRWRWLLAHLDRVPVDRRHPAPTLAADGLHGANLYRRNIPARILRPRAARRAGVPVQLVVPSGDRSIPAHYYERAERWAPLLRRRVVAGSHWAPRTHPELIARWIGEFVEEVERGAAGSHTPWARGGGTAQLAGRLSLVTGAGSGIGRATALALAARGSRLLLVDRDGDAAARTAAAIPRSHAFTCDVGDERAMERLASEVTGSHGVPDVVVNNAGIGLAGPFLQTGAEDWRRILDVNLLGVVTGSRLFARAMLERGEGGQIVNLSSVAAFGPFRDLAAYGASKAAVLMLSECLRAELAPYGIGVTAVCPGIVATNITRTTRYVGHPEEQQARIREQVTRSYQRRNFTPERVAEQIVEAIGNDTPVAVVTPEAKLARVLSRVAPGVLRRLAGRSALPI